MTIALLIIGVCAAALFYHCTIYENHENRKSYFTIDTNTIFCFWTGNNEMSPKRKKCLDDLYEITECNVVLITPENLQDYLLDNQPLHAGYPFLSETHKADYLRTYFMHFHGGGYSDIKTPSGNWKSAFEDIKKNPDIYMNGYRELEPNHVAVPHLSHHFNTLIGNCAYISRPNTDLTREWYNAMIELMDAKLNDLKSNPATYPQEKPEDGNGYPIEWEEMLGKIFIAKQMNYLPRLLYTVPRPITSDYR